MNPEACVPCILTLVYSLWRTVQSSKSHFMMFQYDEEDTVDFDDIFSGAGNISLRDLLHNTRGRVGGQYQQLHTHAPDSQFANEPSGSSSQLHHEAV